MEWTEDSTIKFINVYKNRPILWNRRHPFHYHKMKRDIAWNEIAKRINRPVDDCKRKMKGLMKSFRREDTKIRNSTGADKQNQLSKWYAYESLKFFLDKNQPIKVPKAKPVPRKELPELVVSLTKIVKKEPTAAPPVIDQPQPHHLVPPPQQDQLQSQQEQQLQRQAHEAMRDDSYYFGLMIAAKLRKFDDLTRTMVQHAILGVFLDAARGYYDGNGTQQSPPFGLYPQVDLQYPQQTPTVNGHRAMVDIPSRANTPTESSGGSVSRKSTQGDEESEDLPDVIV